MKTVTIEVSDTVHELLEVLTKSPYAGGTTVEDVLSTLVDHVQQGVYRPGSWERPWLEQVFGDEWLEHLEPGDPWDRDDGGERIFERPRGMRSAR